MTLPRPAWLVGRLPAGLSQFGWLTVADCGSRQRPGFRCTMAGRSPSASVVALSLPVDGCIDGEAGS